MFFYLSYIYAFRGVNSKFEIPFFPVGTENRYRIWIQQVKKKNEIKKKIPENSCYTENSVATT